MNDKSPLFLAKSDRAPEPVGCYVYSRRSGNLLFMSGIGPRQKGSSEIPGVTIGDDGVPRTSNFTDQCLATFLNVEAVLTESGATWEDLVDVTVFLTDMAADFETFNQLWADAFPDPATQPCRTTVQVGALPTPIAIELKCIAEFKPTP